MDEAVVDEALAAFGRALERVMPAIFDGVRERDVLGG
jgi:hypothetical protein